MLFGGSFQPVRESFSKKSYSRPSRAATSAFTGTAADKSISATAATTFANYVIMYKLLDARICLVAIGLLTVAVLFLRAPFLEGDYHPTVCFAYSAAAYFFSYFVLNACKSTKRKTLYVFHALLIPLTAFFFLAMLAGLYPLSVVFYLLLIIPPVSLYVMHMVRATPKQK
jgi:hypothetical protein